MNKPMISASMMCSSLVNLSRVIRIFKEEDVEWLHIDVMDGEFVPNFGLGVDYIRGLRSLTDIPLDIHLMVREPERKFDWLGLRDSDIVSIHYESTFQVQRALDQLDAYGCKKFLALSPATPVGMLEELLSYIDGINLLMVNPGFAGQQMVVSTMRKARKLRDFLAENGREDIVVEVDGNITLEHASTLRGLGASMFIAGTSSIFRGNVAEYAGNIRRLRQAIR